MNGLRLAGVVWIVAAVIAIVISIAYRFEMMNSQLWAVVTIVAGLIAALLGVVLAWRMQTFLVRWSTILGIGWVVLYVALALQQAYEVEAWATDVALAVIGGLAALIAYRASRPVPAGGPS